MDSPNSIKFPFSSEIDQETTYSCDSLRRLDDNPLLDTLLDQTGHIPRISKTGPDSSPEFYPNSLLLSQPDGRNTWTLSLDPTASHSATISESSVELESLSLLSSHASDEAIARPFPSVSSTPRHNTLSLPPSQDDVAKFNSSSDVSMIVSSTPSVQRQGERTTPVPSNSGNADLYSDDLPHGLVSHCQPLSDSVLGVRQPSRSKKLIKKSKNIFGRFKKLFTPKGTVSEDVHHTSFHPKSDPIAAIPPVSERRFLPSYQRYRLTKSSMSLTPSFGQSFSPEDTNLADDNVDEKYTYEYHARPKTLREIKSQRRFSLPLVFGGTSSRVTPPTKRNVTTSFSHPQSRPMSIYFASQNEILDFAA